LRCSFATSWSFDERDPIDACTIANSGRDGLFVDPMGRFTAMRL